MASSAVKSALVKAFRYSSIVNLPYLSILGIILGGLPGESQLVSNCDIQFRAAVMAAAAPWINPIARLIAIFAPHSKASDAILDSLLLASVAVSVSQPEITSARRLMPPVTISAIAPNVVRTG